MPPRKLYSFAIDPDLAEGLKTVKERDGISESEQIRRAIRQWLADRHAITKTKRARRR
jgi:Arc/MetJ-type ribon-helix-helix transcriptional regulator